MSRVQDCRLHINEAVNDIRLILSCQAETKIRKTGSIYFNLFEKSTPFMAGLEEIPCFCLYSFFLILFRLNTRRIRNGCCTFGMTISLNLGSAYVSVSFKFIHITHICSARLVFHFVHSIIFMIGGWQFLRLQIYDPNVAYVDIFYLELFLHRHFFLMWYHKTCMQNTLTRRRPRVTPIRWTYQTCVLKQKTVCRFVTALLGNLRNYRWLRQFI